MLLASSELAGPIAGNSREKVELLSLKISLSLSPLASLSLFPSPKLIWVKVGQENCPLTCQVSSFHWLMGLHPYPYPSTLRFSPNGMMPCVSSEPHLSSSLTASALDTCRLLATQNVPSVLHPSRCLEKREIPTVSEFDEIRRGS